jgi:(p)ppGpp synthase/HD superfamily hydrolase
MKNMLATAIRISTIAHMDQFDKAGKAYILHPLRIMFRLRTDDEELMQIAVLHDVVEDSKHWSLGKLLDAGFSSRVISALTLLTHREVVPYEEYIEEIGTNADAIKVKKEDLRDNSDITRLKGVTEKDLLRMRKYHKAFVRLTELEKGFN